MPLPIGHKALQRDALATRIITSSIVALMVVLAMTGWTLWLSWQLEGAAAAINDTGSLRMRANLIGIGLLQPGAALAPREAMRQQQDTLARLREGVPSRPLFLPQDEGIRQQFEQVTRLWREGLSPHAEQALAGLGPEAYLRQLPVFVAEADRLVGMIETDNAEKTTMLRLSQISLIVLACVGTLTMVYLLYLWIISPVMRLQDGVERMTAREFHVRLPVESKDEFGWLAMGFNRMAEELESLYRDLESRVAQKTEQLGDKNRELEALYGMAAFLNQPNSIEAMCQGFLTRLRQQFDADGASIRTVDPSGDKLILMVSEGLPSGLSEEEHCMRVSDCLCGATVSSGTIVIHDFRKTAPARTYQCEKQGFSSIAIAQIRSIEQVTGALSLHFAAPRKLAPHEQQLLEALGRHLGVALENRRLAAEARQLAVARERQLVAQGLHDSLAQGLNFLNLQVQLLQDALRRQDQAEIEEIVPLLRAGVDEGYQDVRELLTNFRSKLERGELMPAIEQTVERFRRQTGLPVHLEIEDEGGPLPPEQQLEMLFILQEALSNIRKHAEASEVRVSVRNRRGFQLRVSDDGQGFEAGRQPGEPEQHIGLKIMAERAARAGARLHVEAAPGKGVCVTVELDAQERVVA